MPLAEQDDTDPYASQVTSRLLVHRLLVNNDHALAHVSCISQVVNCCRDTVQAMVQVGFDFDVVFGDHFEHFLTFLLRANEGALNPDVTKEVLLERY